MFNNIKKNNNSWISDPFLRALENPSNYPHGQKLCSTKQQCHSSGKISIKMELKFSVWVLHVLRLLIALSVITFRHENCLKLIRLVRLHFENKIGYCKESRYLTGFDVIKFHHPTRNSYLFPLLNPGTSCLWNDVIKLAFHQYLSVSLSWFLI